VREALAFLTPLGRATTPTPRALAWFAPVGLLVGGLTGAVWWAAGEVWEPGVAAALVVIADLTLTGLLHLDGLADSADGLLPPLPLERRLEVMREPTLGAFGVGVSGGALLLRWSTLAALSPEPVLLAGLWATSRAAMAVVVISVPYARPAGIASAFLGARVGPWLIVASLLGPAAATLATGGAGLAAAGAVAGGAAGVAALARHRLGGFTGDVLGAAAFTGETAGLLVAAALLEASA